MHPTHTALKNDQTPPLRLIAWEVTRSCNLACRHCRATAMPDPAPGELSTAESIALLDDITGFGDTPQEAVQAFDQAYGCAKAVCDLRTLSEGSKS